MFIIVMVVIELYVGRNSAMESTIVMIVSMKKDIFAVSFYFPFFLANLEFQIERCINNLYSCTPEHDIRCDLACNALDYVPCQTIQDRRACNHIRQHRTLKSLLSIRTELRICSI